MTTIEQIKQTLEDFAEKKRVFIEQLRQEFPGILAPLFQNSDELESISWTQYTPYFNDGDECTFRCNCGDLMINGEYYSTNVSEETKQVVFEMEEVLRSIPDEFYRELFGEHVEVTCNRDGTISVGEYEHD
tara:strand:+ start:1058 stop:1450 length:393 start_codon:yes stop_codon:yes gene_type:complete